jgi:hypothetical protein
MKFWSNSSIIGTDLAILSKYYRVWMNISDGNNNLDRSILRILKTSVNTGPALNQCGPISEA